MRHNQLVLTYGRLARGATICRKTPHRDTPLLRADGRKPIGEAACRQSLKLATISSIWLTVRPLRVSESIFRKCFLPSKPLG